MTAPPAGALEACLALLEKATPGDWEATVEVFDKGGWEAPTQHVTVYSGDSIVASYSTAYAEFPDDEQNATNATALVAAVNLLRTHGPALLAALRLREWRPIAEAPKDGRSVLIFCKDAVIPAIAFFCEDAGSWMSIAGESFAHPIMWVPAPIPTADDLARVLEQTK